MIVVISRRCVSQTTRNVSLSEIEKFNAMAAHWWQPEGVCKLLHRMNPVRVSYARETVDKYFGQSTSFTKPWQNLTACDVGCGGGLLSESVAQLGAKTLGIDAAELNIQVAIQHRDENPFMKNVDLTYEAITAEQIVQREEKFDLVFAMEIIEHIPNQADFVVTLSQLLKPGGLLFMSTMNRNFLSRLLTIEMAERVLGFVPRGTHDHGNYVTPEEWMNYAKSASLQPLQQNALFLKPWSLTWQVLPFPPLASLTLYKNEKVNFMRNQNNRASLQRERPLHRQRSLSPNRRSLSPRLDYGKASPISKSVSKESSSLRSRSMTLHLSHSSSAAVATPSLNDDIDLQSVLVKSAMDENALIEERRKARLAILEKYKNEEQVESKSIDSSIVVEQVKQSVAVEQTKMDVKSELKSDAKSVDDMFADDFDMFADDEKMTMPAVPKVSTAARIDNWDDEEGYYRAIIGEMLDQRYHIYANLGKGVFSTVVRALDTKDKDKQVAIKIVRSNEMMTRAAHKEIKLLQRLQQHDPMDTKHLIQLYRSFEYRGHLCLVFESLSMNLREVANLYGRGEGLNLSAVRVYAQQMFLALSHLAQCGIIHADIKPDNMLVNESRAWLKVCDLGSASSVKEPSQVTPYLVSRFYRAPEIILGWTPLDCAVDVWSVACSLFEIYTGQILFPGHSNNQMLEKIMALRGRFPVKMLKRGQFTSDHFDEDKQFQFLLHEPNTLPVVKRWVHLQVPNKELRHLLPPDEDAWLLQQFTDLLEKCLILQPDKRITAMEALSHPFLKGK